MTKSHSKIEQLPWATEDLLGEPIADWPDEFDSSSVEPGDELPLFRVLGVATPSDVAAQLGYIRGFLKVAVGQKDSLDSVSNTLLDAIFVDLALGLGDERRSLWIKKAMTLYLEEVEREG